jgi:hypothetical protein
MLLLPMANVSKANSLAAWYNFMPLFFFAWKNTVGVEWLTGKSRQGAPQKMEIGYLLITQVF